MKKVNSKRNLKKEYENVLEAIISKFFIKQGYEENGVPFEYETLGVIDGGTYSSVLIYDICFNVDDIIYDMFNNVKEGTILEWYDYNEKYMIRGYDFVAYKCYVMGYRHRERTKAQEFLCRAKKWLSGLYNEVKYYRSNKEFRKMLKERMDKEVFNN